METAVFKDLGIKGRVLLLTLLPTSLLALVLGGYFTWMQLAELRSQLHERGELMVQHLARWPHRPWPARMPTSSGAWPRKR